MKKIVKVLSVIMIFAIIPVLTACGNNESNSKKTTTELDVNIEKVAEAYLNAYLGKEVNLKGTGLKEEDFKDYVCKRDYKVINTYSNKDGKDEELLQAYYEALKKVEFSIKSSDIREVTVAIKGIDISGVKKAAKTHMMRVKRQREVNVDELRVEGENKAIEALKEAPVLEEKEIKLNFTKTSDDKIIIADSAIEGIENSISYLEENYTRFAGDVPEEFKSLKNK